MMKLYWFTDGVPSPGSVPRNGGWVVVPDFPPQQSLIDADTDDEWKDSKGEPHKGTPVGRALPFDNGDGTRWSAIVYTNADPLVTPPKKASGLGSEPSEYGDYIDLDQCKKTVEETVRSLTAQ
jgi:hypothetical protein